MQRWQRQPKMKTWRHESAGAGGGVLAAVVNVNGVMSMAKTQAAKTSKGGAGVSIKETAAAASAGICGYYRFSGLVACENASRLRKLSPGAVAKLSG